MKFRLIIALIFACASARAADQAYSMKDLNALEGGSSLIIGHETHLSEFTMHLLTGSDGGFLQFKKAGIACLSYEEKIESKKMNLEWLLTPKLCLSL